MTLNQVTTTQLKALLQDGWRILHVLNYDANGLVLTVQRPTGAKQELLELTDVAQQPITANPPNKSGDAYVNGTTPLFPVAIYDPILGSSAEAWQGTDQGGGLAVPTVNLGGGSATAVTVAQSSLGGSTNLTANQSFAGANRIPLDVVNIDSISDSISKGGSQTAPGALATIVSITPGTAGVYLVNAWATIALGVPAAGDENNMRLRVTATTIMDLPYVAGFGGPFGPFRLTLTALNTLNIVSIGAGTAGVVYVAGITARRVA